jgi:peptide-methionine (R)-S-oxide reductase
MSFRDFFIVKEFHPGSRIPSTWTDRKSDASGADRWTRGEANTTVPKIDPTKVAELAKQLSPEQYDICFRSATEAPFSGELTYEQGTGTYHCVVCGTALFTSDAKFISKTGWPSFDAPIAEALEEHADRSYGMVRIEVRCGTCGAHLGHVFDDGPTATGKRFCINSRALEFKKSEP